MPEDQVKIKKQSHESDGMVCCSDDEYYPYGTSLSLNGDMVEELDAGNLAVGDIVEIRGFAFVERKFERSDIDDKDGPEKSLGFQFTTLKIKRETDDRAVQLYGPDS